MAARKKKRKIVKTKTKTRKKAPAKRKVVKAGRKAAPKKTARKAAPKKKAAVKAKATAKKAPRRASKGEFGEGNYKASKRFRKSEEAFVKANKAKIPALGKAAEDALDGPEGDALRAAEAQAASHAAGQHE